MSGDERYLQSLAVVRCSGPDADSFLQGQLTSDIARLEDRTQLATYATPQGRVVAILRLSRRDDGIYMLLPVALTATLAERLRKFVLRAKVSIDVLEGWSVTGVGHPALRPGDAARAADASTPIAFDYPDGRTAVAHPCAAGTMDSEAEEMWQVADIVAGLPQIGPETTGHFIPQMLNLDLLDAISFTKGCYTGQEIVARTQYLGRIKRRMFRFAIRGDEAPAPLTALHLDGAKVGEVLMGARTAGGIELLAVIALDARDRRCAPRPVTLRCPATALYRLRPRQRTHQQVRSLLRPHVREQQHVANRRLSS